MDTHHRTRRSARAVCAAALGLGAALMPGSAAVADPVPAAGPSDADRVALAQLWERQAGAWARGDGHAYGATYTADADFVNVTGEHIHTGREIGTRFQRYLGAQLKNSRIITLEEKIQMLSPTLAYIIRKGCVFFAKETSCHPNTLSWNTSLVVKDSGRWLVRSFHNTLVNPPR